MKYDIAMNLLQDWNETVRHIFRASEHPLPEGMSDKEIGILYFLQTAETEEEAERMQIANEERLHHLEQTIIDNFESVILPDIRSRTGYREDSFSFKWVYNFGEHIIEEKSEYRIPL